MRNNIYFKSVLITRIHWERLMDVERYTYEREYAVNILNINFYVASYSTVPFYQAP